MIIVYYSRLLSISKYLTMHYDTFDPKFQKVKNAFKRVRSDATLSEILEFSTRSSGTLLDNFAIQKR